MTNRKICVFTGSRAEYGLLYWIIKGIQDNPGMELQLIVGGMHLSPEFGLTYKQIEADGFPILKKVETLLSSDTPVGVSKSIGLGVISLSEVFAEIKPDILLLLGDRFETFAAAVSAMVARIPIGHFHGGETTEGVIDESIRHSITKMSHIHFTSTEIYRKRVIQLGEQPEYVVNVGALGIESINKLELLSKGQFEKELGIQLDKRNILVTFHPATLEDATSEKQFKDLIKALDELEDTKIIFTKSNADIEGRIINDFIDKYVSVNIDKAAAFTSLGQLKYLSALKYVDVVVGNSSSGLLEVPSFKKPTINIGDRQKGRVRGITVIDCEPDFHSIKNALNIAFNTEFLSSIKDSINPYGTGNASYIVLEELKSVELNRLLKKKFNDL
ncbi:MAG: UDP-N-acetylglucosamine 2-epimerase [Pedobacter sp.]|nr:UDP-N-acetylglucosamine 2-epimerase [Pedobacter sp.]